MTGITPALRRDADFVLSARPGTERVPLLEAIELTGLTRAQLLGGLESDGARSAAENDGIPAARIADYLLERARGLAQDVPDSSVPSKWRVLKVFEKAEVGRQMLIDLAPAITRLARIKAFPGDTFRHVEAIIMLAAEYVEAKKALARRGRPPGRSSRPKGGTDHDPR